MSRTPRSYGDEARTLLQRALREGWCTQESFAASIGVSRAMVASWSTGREPMPGNALPLLLRHVGPDLRAALQVLAELVGDEGYPLLVVERPSGLADGAEPLVLAAQGSGAMGRLVEHVATETARGSDGGVTRTPAELRERLALVEAAEEHLGRLRAETLAAIQGRPLAVVRA